MIVSSASCPHKGNVNQCHDHVLIGKKEIVTKSNRGERGQRGEVVPKT